MATGRGRLSAGILTPRSSPAGDGLKATSPTTADAAALVPGFKFGVRRWAVMAGSSASIQLLSIASALVLTPLLVSRLGVTGYGIYATAMTVPLLLAVADLGLGNSLVAPLAQALETADHDRARALTVTTRRLLGIASVCLTGLTSVTVASLALAGVIETSGTPFASAIALIFLGVGLPFGLTQRIRLAAHELERSNLWQALGIVVGTGCTGFVLSVHPSVILALCAILGGRLLGTVADTISGTVRYRTWLQPRTDANQQSVHGLWSISSAFLMLQVCALLAYQTDLWVINIVLGPKAVTSYSIPQRLFSLAPQLASFMLTPFWPGFARALALGDARWMRNTLRRMLWLSTTLALVFSGLLVWFGQPLIRIWLGGASDGVEIPTLLMIAIAAWTVVNCVSLPLAAFLNGAQIVRPQMWAALVMVLLNLSLSIVLTEVIGLSGPAWGSVIAQCVTAIPVSLWLIRRTLRSLG